MTVENRLFVYGTFVPGGENAHILEAFGGEYYKASLKGEIVIAQWGRHKGLRGLDYQPLFQNVVYGYIFESENLNSNWSIIDEFEGDAFPRRPVTVLTEKGENIECFAYIYVAKL